jgi:hypothetical protein
LLLESDPQLPCVVTIVTGKRLRESWWGHASSGLIYKVLKQVAANSAIAESKLVAGKVTYVHRRLWPQLVRVETAGERWQYGSLSLTARTLLSQVGRRGVLETNRLSSFLANSRRVSEAARELERVLLVHGESYHTESGFHAKRLETWEHWSRRNRLSKPNIKLERAKTQLEEAVMKLSGGPEGIGLLPWTL